MPSEFHTGLTYTVLFMQLDQSIFVVEMKPNIGNKFHEMLSGRCRIAGYDCLAQLVFSVLTYDLRGTI